LCRAPQQLVTHRECAQVLRTHVQLAQTPYWNAHRAGHSSRAEFLDAGFTMVRDQFHPWVVLADQTFDISDGDVFVQLDGQRLTVATHGADAHTDAVDRNRALEATED